MSKTLPLKDVPEDVYSILLAKQGELKQDCSCQKSLPTTVYAIVRFYDKVNAIKELVKEPLRYGRAKGWANDTCWLWDKLLEAPHDSVTKMLTQIRGLE